MSKELNEALDFAAMHTTSRTDQVSEIQHPTDLIAGGPYFNLARILLFLGVLPLDVFMMSSPYWSEYDV